MKNISLYVLLLITLLSTGCDDANLLPNINQNPADYGTLQWDVETGEVFTNYIYRYDPAYDIELKVPDHLVYTPRVIGSLPPGRTSGYPSYKDFSDEQTTLSTYFAGFLDDKIYIPDWRGMKIYAFDLQGNFLEDETIDRAQISCENYAEYDNPSNFGDKILNFWTTDRLIYMVVSYMWDCTGTNWREDVDKLFIVRINPRAERITINLFNPGIPFGDAVPIPSFAHNDVMYSKYYGGDRHLRAYDAYTYIPLPDKNLVFEDNYDFWWERGEESKYPSDPGGVLYQEFGRAGYGHTFGWTIDPVPPLVALTWHPELPEKYANGLLWTRNNPCSITPEEQSYYENRDGYPEKVEVNPLRSLRIEGIGIGNYITAYDLNGNYTGIFLKPVDCQYNNYAEADHDPNYIWGDRVHHREYAAASPSSIVSYNNIIYTIDFDIWTRHSDEVNVSDDPGIPGTYFLRAYR